MKTVMVSGDFGRIHEGHIDHIIKAYALGDWLVIATHTDKSIVARKSYIPMPLWARIVLLRGILAVLGNKGEVVITKDTDGESTKTLKWIAPNIFAKGGDRVPGNIPQEEVDVCQEIGCEIVYGVGGRLNSSTKLAKELREKV